MDARDFVALLKHDAVDSSANDILSALAAPAKPPAIPVTGDSAIASGIAGFVYRAKIEQYRRASWFQALRDEDRQFVKQLLQECAELTALSVLAIVDGVGGNTPGIFEIVEVEGNMRRVINQENTEMLHDLFSEICENERASR